MALAYFLRQMRPSADGEVSFLSCACGLLQLIIAATC